MSNRELDLVVDDVKDEFSQENFDRIREFIADDLFTKFDGAFFEIVFGSSVTGIDYPHNLGFIPKDVLLTSSLGAGTITFNYDSFTTENLNITTTDAVTVRFVAGQFVTDR